VRVRNFLNQLTTETKTLTPARTPANSFLATTALLQSPFFPAVATDQAHNLTPDFLTTTTTAGTKTQPLSATTA